MKRIVIALALVALAVTGCGSSSSKASGAITIQVTGNNGEGVGAAGATVTVLDGPESSQHANIALPFTTSITDSPRVVGVAAQSEDDSSLATISCEIDVPGKEPIQQSSSGAFSVVDCSAVP